MNTNLFTLIRFTALMVLGTLDFHIDDSQNDLKIGISYVLILLSLACGEDQNCVQPHSEDISNVLHYLFYAGCRVKIKIMYSTTPQCSALQWLEPNQTASKTHPYLFSQCQAIHCRSMVPCQDTPSVKAPYSAEVNLWASAKYSNEAKLVRDSVA
jgi:aminopeptidase N